jgi:hypothetical protein
MARLITDVDAAVNKPFKLLDEDSDGYIEDQSKSEEFYKRTSEYYTGSFKTGLAVPVSAQNGNPYMFGPNIIVDYNEKRVEKIMVVNRSDKSFTAGTLVLCTLIGAEWIIQEFSLPSEFSFPTRMGAWTFSKLMANSDSFFRNLNGDSFIWSIADYSEKARALWYADWKDRVSNGQDSILEHHNADDILDFNTDPISDVGVFNPSLGYYVASSFDSSDYPEMINGNVDQALQETQGYLFGTGFGPAWGPFFPDGYLASGPARTGATNAKTLIADIALNGPYDDNHGCAPYLPLELWQEKLSGLSLALGSETFYDMCYNYRNHLKNSPSYVKVN